MQSPKKHFYLALYLLIAGIYLLTVSGRIGLSDGVAMFNVSHSIITDGTFSSEPCVAADPGHPNHCVPGRNGRYYAGFGLLPSVLAVPALIGAKAVATLLHVNSVLAMKLGVSLFAAIVTPLTGVVLCMWILKLGYTRLTAVFGGLIVSFASSIWHLGVKGFFSEPFYTLGILLAGYFLSCAEFRFATFLSGLAFGAACACRLNGLILFPAFIVCIAFRISQPGDFPKRFFKDTLFFSAGFTVWAILIGWANYIRFDSPLKTGYHLAYPSVSSLLPNPLWVGIRDLLFSPEIGLLVFTPWILLAFFCFPSFFKKHKPEAALCASIFLISLLFFAKYDSWHGGWVIGPRFLSPAIPFLALPLVPWIETIRHTSDQFTQPRLGGAFRLALVGLVSFSLLLQALGLSYSDERYYILRTQATNKPMTSWSFSAPPFAVLRFVFHRSKPLLPGAASPELRPSDSLTLNHQGSAIAPNGNSAMTEEEFLRLLPNSENYLVPNFMLLKFKLMGLPDSLLFAYLIFSLALAFLGVLGLRKSARP